jgi:hypothetical protein
MAGEGVGVVSEVGGEEDGLLVNGLLAGGEESGGSLVCGGGEEVGLLADSTERGLTALEVVVAVGAVVASGAVLDGGGDEVPPESGKKMAPSQSGKEMEE